MESIDLKGWIVPGMTFSDGTRLWLLRWEENPLFPEAIMEIWIIYPDGRRVCWASRPDMADFISKYHGFEEIIPMDIDCRRCGKNGWEITAEGNGTSLMLSFRTGSGFITGILNFMLCVFGSEKCASKGLTETGRHFINFPKGYFSLRNVKLRLEGADMALIPSGKEADCFGDSKSSELPLFLYCVNRIEK